MINWDYANQYENLPGNEAMVVEALVKIAEQLANLTEQLKRLTEIVDNKS